MPSAEPNIIKLHFDIPVISGTSMLDISQCLSIVNRKFFPQGLNWVVANIELVTDGTVILGVSKLPDSWTLANSWVKAEALWRESQDQVLDVDGRSIQAKYSDFKIFYDSDHQAVGTVGNLVPFGYDIAAGSATYDWDSTDIQIPNDPVPGTTTGYDVHALGPSNAASKGMIAGYAASRSRPQQEDPNIVSTSSSEGWMLEMFDVGDNLEEIRADIQFENDSPPYLVGEGGTSLEYYPGGAYQATTYLSHIHDYLVTRKGTSLAMDATGSFLAPCGLIRLEALVDPEDAPTQMTVFVEVAPGPVRGLLAQPMQEMN